jgi:phospholipid-translocating ATPase
MPETGKIYLFCKGADSIIYSRLRKGEQAELRRTTAEHLEVFAREGLRTLCIAQKELTEEQYQAWSKEYDVAAAAVNQREEKIEEVSDAIERDLTLLVSNCGSLLAIKLKLLSTSDFLATCLTITWI